MVWGGVSEEVIPYAYNNTTPPKPPVLYEFQNLHIAMTDSQKNDTIQTT